MQLHFLSFEIYCFSVGSAVSSESTWVDDVVGFGEFQSEELIVGVVTRDKRTSRISNRRIFGRLVQTQVRSKLIVGGQ